MSAHFATIASSSRSTIATSCALGLLASQARATASTNRPPRSTPVAAGAVGVSSSKLSCVLGITSVIASTLPPSLCSSGVCKCRNVVSLNPESCMP